MSQNSQVAKMFYTFQLGEVVNYRIINSQVAIKMTSDWADFVSKLDMDSHGFTCFPYFLHLVSCQWIYGSIVWKWYSAVTENVSNVLLNLDPPSAVPGIPFQFGPHGGVPERRAGDAGFLFAGPSCEAHDDPGSR